MKEATGELSTTVIAVVAIAAISSLFIVFLYPQLKSNIILNQACSNGPGYNYVDTNGGYGVACQDKQADGNWNCGYCEKNGNNNVTACTYQAATKTKPCQNNN